MTCRPGAPRTASPASKRVRRFNNGNDDVYGSERYGDDDEDIGGSNIDDGIEHNGESFGVDYMDDAPDASDDDNTADGGGGEGGGGGGGTGGGGRKSKKNRNRPWKVHGRRPGGGGAMHDANVYRHYRPDFRELAREYPGMVWWCWNLVSSVSCVFAILPGILCRVPDIKWVGVCSLCCLLACGISI